MCLAHALLFNDLSLHSIYWHDIYHLFVIDLTRSIYRASHLGRRDALGLRPERRESGGNRADPAQQANLLRRSQGVGERGVPIRKRWNSELPESRGGTGFPAGKSGVATLAARAGS